MIRRNLYILDRELIFFFFPEYIDLLRFSCHFQFKLQISKLYKKERYGKIQDFDDFDGIENFLLLFA